MENDDSKNCDNPHKAALKQIQEQFKAFETQTSINPNAIKSSAEIRDRNIMIILEKLKSANPGVIKQEQSTSGQQPLQIKTEIDGSGEFIDLTGDDEDDPTLKKIKLDIDIFRPPPLPPETVLSTVDMKLTYGVITPINLSSGQVVSPSPSTTSTTINGHDDNVSPSDFNVISFDNLVDDVKLRMTQVKSLSDNQGHNEPSDPPPNVTDSRDGSTISDAPIQILVNKENEPSPLPSPKVFGNESETSQKLDENMEKITADLDDHDYSKTSDAPAQIVNKVTFGSLPSPDIDETDPESSREDKNLEETKDLNLNDLYHGSEDLDKEIASQDIRSVQFPGTDSESSDDDSQMEESFDPVDSDGHSTSTTSSQKNGTDSHSTTSSHDLASWTLDQIEMKLTIKATMSDSKIVAKIIKNLEFPELKSARLVNSQWNEISSRHLLSPKQPIAQIFVHYDASRKLFRKSSRLEWKHPSYWYPPIPKNQPVLSDLNKLFENLSNDSLCQVFCFSKGDLGNEHVQNFFENHGHKIKKLYLKENNATKKSTFETLLQDKLPNLESLDISKFVYTWDDEDEINLPSSTTQFNFDCPETARVILRPPSNLKKVGDITAIKKAIKVLIDTNKLDLVKKIESCNENLDLDRLALFANGNPKLEKFWTFISNKFRKFTRQENTSLVKSVNKIINSSQETLKELWLFGLMPCSRLKLPVLEKLEILRFSWNSCPATPCLPKGTNLRMKFPNLKIIEFGGLINEEDSDWDKHFPEGTLVGDLPSVKTVVLYNNCTKLWLEKIKEVCPNFKKLLIRGIWFESSIKMVTKVLKKWTHLETLELEIRENFPKNFDKELDLDNKLGGFVNGKIDLQRPSLLDLKGLKKFKISFRCPHEGLARVLKNSKRPILSLSDNLIFKDMPDLKVSILYDQNCQYTPKIRAAFAHLRHVNFKHFHDYRNNKLPTKRKKGRKQVN